MFAAMILLQDASSLAMHALEERMHTISVVDAATSSQVFARHIVRPAMRAQVGHVSDDWFNAQARALRQLDPRLEALALRFAAMGERPPLPQGKATGGADRSVPAWLRGPADRIGSAVERMSAQVAGHAIPRAIRQGTEQVLAHVGRQVGEHAGVYERLRVAARGELSGVWLGPARPDATQRPYLAQLLDSVDRTATQALEIIA